MAVKRRAAGNPGPARAGTVALAVLVLLAAACWLAARHLGAEIRERFDGQRWALPTLVYARPLELYAGLSLRQRDFEEELPSLGPNTWSDGDAPLMPGPARFRNYCGRMRLRSARVRRCARDVAAAEARAR